MSEAGFPLHISHYYEASRGPLLTLSDLPSEEAEALIINYNQEKGTMNAQRDGEYMGLRRQAERMCREQFIAKGGKPQRENPHYFCWGGCGLDDELVSQNGGVAGAVGCF